MLSHPYNIAWGGELTNAILQPLCKVETIRVGAALELVREEGVLGVVGGQLTQRGSSKMGMCSPVHQPLGLLTSKATPENVATASEAKEAWMRGSQQS